MGMASKEYHEGYQKGYKDAKEEFKNTMRKYQKIEQIVKVWHQDIYAKDFECMAEIAEVVEDE